MSQHISPFSLLSYPLPRPRYLCPCPLISCFVDVVYMISDLKKIVNGDTRCFFLLQSTRSVSGHISHHDRCRVGSVRLSDSVAKKPISAKTDSQVYQRCLRAPPSQKLILRGWWRRRRTTKLMRRRRMVGIYSVASVPRRKSCFCVRLSSCTRSSWQHLQPDRRARRLDAVDSFA